MFKFPGLCCAIVLAVLGVGSCKKITNDQLVNGIWRLDAVYVDTSTNNYLNTLPYFNRGGGCCTYKMDFQKDDVVLAYYLTYDTFTRIAAGNWMLNSSSEITIKLDNFIDGTFNILKPSTKKWELTSPANHIAAFDSINPQFDTTYTSIVMEKI